MTLPKVSICIPAYQAPDLLRRALQSIFVQSYENYEVIITDDSSNNSIQDIIKEFETDSRLKYYRNSERKGSPNNWNEAVKYATGEYIKLLHHDDWLSEKDSLYKFVKMLDDNPNADFAFCSSAAYGPDEKLLFVHRPSKKQLSQLLKNPDYLFPENFVGAPSATIYRKRTNLKFDSRTKWVVDIDLYISLLRKNKTFVYCQEPLICIMTGSADQVTALCENDRTVQLFEWLYLFNKLNQGRIPHFRHIKFVWSLLTKYRVKSTSDIINVGLLPPYSKVMYALLLLRRLVPFS